MEAHDDILDRADVERIAHEVIGRQFRLPALLSVVLLIIGFVLGHYVASRHVKDVSDRLEARIAKLDAALAEVEKTSAIAVAENPFESGSGRNSETTTGDAAITGNPFSREAPLELSPEPPAIPSSKSQSPFRLSGMSSASYEPTSTGLTTSSLRETVERMKKETADERARCIEELVPHMEQRSRIPVIQVSAVVEDIFATQERRLARIVDEASGASVALHDLSSTFRSDLDRSERMFPPLQSAAPIENEKPSSHAATPRTVARSRDLGGNRYFSAPNKVVGGYFFTPSRKKGGGETDAMSAEGPALKKN